MNPKWAETIRDLIGRRNTARTSLVEAEDELDEAEDELIATRAAQGVLQSIAETIQQKASSKIAQIVTRCLSAVFDDPYAFRIVCEQKRGKTEARLVFVRDGHELDNPEFDVGGGCIDVAAFALRLASLLLSRPPTRRLLVLDEPFKCIRGKDNRQRVRSLLVALAEEFDVQFILNVDIDAYPEFCLGKVVELG